MKGTAIAAPVCLPSDIREFAKRTPDPPPSTIGGFDLTAFAAGSTLVFTTRFSGDTAGREPYFLRAAELNGGGGGSDGAPVPEPATILLVASGLAGALASR